MKRTATIFSTILFTMNVGSTLADTYVSAGTILSNTSWSSGVYVLDGIVSVAPGVTLTIAPGATVLTKGASTLLVAGNLIAVGTETQRITFSSFYQAAPGSYATGTAISLSNSVGSRIEYTTIEKAQYGLSLDGLSTLTIKNNLFKNNYIAITDMYGYQPMDVQHNEFTGNWSAISGIRTLEDSHFNFNNFENNTNVFKEGFYSGNVDVSSNNFVGSSLVMRAPEVGYGYGTVSMLNNWWGTTDVAAIEGMIYDRNDLGTLQRINYSVAGQAFETAGIVISTPVPEPKAVLLFGSGLIAMIIRLRLRKREEA